jgi:hypothetical protein
MATLCVVVADFSTLFTLKLGGGLRPAFTRFSWMLRSMRSMRSCARSMNEARFWRGRSDSHAPYAGLGDRDREYMEEAVELCRPRLEEIDGVGVGEGERARMGTGAGVRSPVDDTRWKFTPSAATRVMACEGGRCA